MPTAGTNPATCLVRGQWHLIYRAYGNPRDSGELNWDRYIRHARISNDGKMQVRPGCKAGVARVGYVLPAHYTLADAHADRIPPQVGINGDSLVFCEESR